jgi:putative membrane protein
MKRILSILFSAAILLCTAVPAFAAGASTPKEEVVYGILDHDGSVQSIYVVNSFRGGKITDYGDYSAVSNMTSSEQLTQNGDAITVETAADHFYYQGTLKARHLPWTFAIKYSLNGKEIPPSELAGKSGALAIAISVVANPAANPVFFENYMLQISLTLDTRYCADIQSENATIASAGRNKVVAHTVMPNTNAQITITANVQDFSMGGIEITAMPFSMPIEVPDTAGLTGDMTRLADAVDELNEGVAKLSDGISQTYAGARRLADGSADVAGGLSQLGGYSTQLLEASSQIHAALASIAGGLEGQSGEEGFNPGDFDALPGALRQLADGLNQIAGNIEPLKTGYASAYSALDAAIMAIPASDVDPTPLYALVYGNQELTHALDQLVEHYAASKAVKATYDATKQAFATVESSLDAISSSIGTVAGTLSEMADAIDQALNGMDLMLQLRQLKQGLSQLSNRYSQFHDGLNEYMNGVLSLSNGYGAVHQGIQSLKGGLGQLNSGAKELSSGTSELNDAVAGLPDEVQAEIDELTKRYDKSDFTPVSFVSEKNIVVSAVQFVLKTPPIELPEVQPATSPPVKLTFWQRLLRLFGLYP